MYTVSDLYKQAVEKLYRKSAIRAKVTRPDGTVFNLTQDNIRKCSIKSQCVSNNSFELGAVCSSELSISVQYDLGNDVLGSCFFIEYGIEISENVFEYIPLGKFYVTEISKGNISEITACDIISFADSNDDVKNNIGKQITNSAQAYDILQIICNYAGIACGNTRAEIESLPNGSLYTYVPESCDISSTRDALSYLSQWLGGFVTTDRNGNLIIRRHERYTECSASINTNSIKSGSLKISDFQLIMRGALVKLNEDGSTWAEVYYFEEKKPNYKTLDFTGNPFFMGYYFLNGGENPGVMFDPLGNIATQCVNVQWIPLQADCFGGNPALDAGDAVIINGTKTVISHSTWNFHGIHTISCCGKDSRILKGVRNQNKRIYETTDKKVSNAKGKNVTQAEFDEMQSAGKLIEGQMYNIIG